MSFGIEFIIGVVREILVRPNGDDRDWQVLDAHYSRGQGRHDKPPAGFDEPPASGDVPRTTVLILIAADADIIGAHLVLAIARERTIAARADRLQDQMVEATKGKAVPLFPATRTRSDSRDRRRVELGMPEGLEPPLRMHPFLRALPLLPETGVAVAPGIDFDPIAGHTWIRPSFAGATADVEEGCAGWAPGSRGPGPNGEA